MVESALYMLTGIAFYGGAHQLILGVRQTPVHPHALHGVMYLLLSGFSLASALTYQSHSLSTLVPAGKLTVTMGILLWGLLAWFVAAYTQVKLRLVLVALTTAWTIHLIGNIGAPLSLMYSEINPVEQTLPSGQIQMSWQSTLSVWWHAVQLTILATLAYCVYAGLQLFRHGDKRAAAALACGLLVLLVTSITDLLVNVQAIELAFLTPFGFLALLVASSIYPGLRNRKTEEAESLPANYNLTFNVNQAPYANAPAQGKAPGNFEGSPKAGLAMKQKSPPFTYAPEREVEVVPKAATDEVADQDSIRSEQVAEKKAGEEDGLAARPIEVSKPKERDVEPLLDESTLTHVSDNLIDIAVYATMVLNRFKRGDVDPETVEALCKKVRAQAIETRRMTSQLSRKYQNDQESEPPAG